MPSAFTWLGGPGLGGGDPQAWSGDQVPTSTDDVYFDGSVSNYDCVLTYMQGTFHSAHLVNGYGGTVYLPEGMTVATLS